MIHHVVEEADAGTDLTGRLEVADSALCNDSAGSGYTGGHAVHQGVDRRLPVQSYCVYWIVLLLLRAVFRVFRIDWFRRVVGGGG